MSGFTHDELWRLCCTQGATIDRYEVFLKLFGFLCLRERHRIDRAGVERSASRIWYWLKERNPEFVVAVLEKARRDVRFAPLEAWRNCEFWLENTVLACCTHPDLKYELILNGPDVAGSNGISEPGEYVDESGRKHRVVEIYDGAAWCESSDPKMPTCVVLPRTKNWRRVQLGQDLGFRESSSLENSSFDIGSDFV